MENVFDVIPCGGFASPGPAIPLPARTANHHPKPAHKKMAEGVGFEPTGRSSRPLDFESSALAWIIHATSPAQMRDARGEAV